MRIWSLCFLFLLHLPLSADEVADTTPESSVKEVSQEKTWEQLCESHQVKAWYMEALGKGELLETDEKFTKLPMLGLFEFREENGRFDRNSSPVRKNIEKDILVDIEEALKNEPNCIPVRLLSLGSTGLLQDWFLVGELIAQGKTQIELTIVDAELIRRSCEGIEKLSKALEAEGITLKLSFFNSLEKCAQVQKTPFHCVYAVDYYALHSFRKDTWRNLAIARKLLAPNGHLFVSYLDEIFTIDPMGKIFVVGTSPYNKLLRDTIVATQRSNPRSKDCSIRMQMMSGSPCFITGPLLYAISDLLQDGYQDLVIYTFSTHLDWFSESDLSELFSDLFAGKGHASLHWKGMYYIQGRNEDRRDMVILDLRGVEVHDLMSELNRTVVLLGRLVPDNGRWIVNADQLGLWVVDGNGRSKAIAVPEENRKTAQKLMAKLFAPGGCWY